MIICDENLSQSWINLFKKLNYRIISIRDEYSGISDLEVTQIAIYHKALLVTEDKDFGEIVFSHGIKDVSVILLRYDQPDVETIERFLVQVLQQHFESPHFCFYTITKQNVRHRIL